jgi:hypothetical protein
VREDHGPGQRGSNPGLSVSETRRAWTEYPNGPRGIVGHVDCTRAYPEDGGDHTDPGVDFPWDVFLAMVQDQLKNDTKEDDVELTDKIGSKAYPNRTLGDVLRDVHGLRDYLVGDPKGATYASVKPGSPAAQLAALPVQIAAMTKTLTAAVAALGAKDMTDETAIIAGVLAGLSTERLGAAIEASGLTPEALAAAIPPEIAQQVVEALVGGQIVRDTATI